MEKKVASGITMPDGTDYEIPVEGSLGLLALGYVGLMKWRERRKTHQATLAEQQTDLEQS